MTDHVRVERSGAVLAITLDRPERRNAITVAMYGAARRRDRERVRRRRDVRVITIRGEGQDFAAGNDLADFLGRRTEARSSGVAAASRAGRDAKSRSSPRCTAIASGIGTTMLLHCDLVIADDRLALLDALRRPGAGPGGRELAAASPARRAGGGRRAICCSPSRSARKRRWRSGWLAIARMRERSTRSWGRSSRACSPSPPKRCA